MATKINWYVSVDKLRVCLNMPEHLYSYLKDHYTRYDELNETRILDEDDFSLIFIEDNDTTMKAVLNVRDTEGFFRLGTFTFNASDKYKGKAFFTFDNAALYKNYLWLNDGEKHNYICDLDYISWFYGMTFNNITELEIAFDSTYNYIGKMRRMIKDTEKYDLYFIGGGQDKQQIQVAQELQKRKESLKEAAEKNAVFLAICGGYQLLGHYYRPHNAERLDGIGLLDAYTVAGNKRFIGNVTAKIITPGTARETLVGFENHSGLTYLQGETKPLAKILTGNGNNGKDKTEGARFKNIFGTYLHGSLLPKNPHFADLLITLALEKRYNDRIELQKLDDDIELAAHNSLVNKKY